MRTPVWEWKWNLNTLAILAGFALSFLGWGYTLAEMQSGQLANAESFDRLDRRVTALEKATRMIDNHELRISMW